MKKYRSAAILPIIIAAAVMLYSCGLTPVDSVTDEEYPLNLTNGSFVGRYIADLDLCLTGDAELVFNNAAEIPQRTLLNFFIFDVNEDDKNTSSPKKKEYYNKDDEKYHIPVSDIEAVIARYFEGAVFDPFELDEFDEERNMIVLSDFPESKGENAVALTEKKKLSDDTMELTVKFYANEDAASYKYTKVFVIKMDEYQVIYQSINKS